MTYYVGSNPQDILGGVSHRYWYGLRRTDNGELFLGKVDQVRNDEIVQVNKMGDPTENYPNFEEGQDFYEGRDTYHNLVYENLNYEQYHWDNRNIYYYINEEGELILKINEPHEYDGTTSSNG